MKKLSKMIEEKQTKLVELSTQVQQFDAQKQEVLIEMVRLEGEIRLLKELTNGS